MSGIVDFDGDIVAVLDLRDVIERVAHHQGIGLSTHSRLAASVTTTRMGGRWAVPL